jgi:hypothetical protein
MKELLYKLIAKGLAWFIQRSANKSKKIAKIVEFMNDEDIHEIIVNGAEYLTKKSTNTYDDKLLAELKKQSTIDTKRARRTVNVHRSPIKKGK